MTALNTVLFLPLIGFIGATLLSRMNKRAIKIYSLSISLLVLALSIALFAQFDYSNSHFQFVTESIWMPSLDIGFRIGLDGMSLLLVCLTALITPIAILASFSAIDKRQKEYYALMLLLEFGMIGVFVSTDLFLFYLFWELILIPMYFIIGIWGGQDRIYASVKFFIFTLVGSLFMLVGIIWLGYYIGGALASYSPDKILSALTPTYGADESAKILFRIKAAGFTSDYNVIKLTSSLIGIDAQKWLFLAFALSFCIKTPLFPFHTWLPDAHTQSPTAGSIILAGILLKMGTYGLIRFNLELFPSAAKEYASAIAILAVIGIIYGALTALVQTDIKKLVAYSSVSHMGFIALGIFSMTEIGLQGAIIQMVNHGLSTGALFLLVGVIYERRHTREMSEFGGIAKVMPKFAVVFSISMLASAGLPGLNGFIGEYLTLLGAFKSPIYDSWIYSAIGSIGVIFAAAYLLNMYQKVFFGEVKNDKNKLLPDINKRELASVLPLIVFMVWIGFYSSYFTKTTEKYSHVLIEKVLNAQSR